MMEGHEYTIEAPGHKSYKFDTSQLTFAFLGAFSGIEQYATGTGGMGFKTSAELELEKEITTLYNEDTIQKFGLLPEFIGRCDTMVALNNLDIDNLIKIIKTSNKSQLLLYKSLFDSMGIKLTYTDSTIEAIARKADDLKLGARSIKKIVEQALEVVNYHIFSSSNYSEIIISPETIEDNTQYILKP